VIEMNSKPIEQLDHFLMATYRPAEVRFVRGEGTYLFDETGKRYLDFLSGIAVCSLGHAHPAIADALCEQARTLLHVSNLYRNELAPRLAYELDLLIGGGTTEVGGRVFFANSGAEANEAAIKLARAWGGPSKYVVVSTVGSFHGRTLATLHATGQVEKHRPFQPLPEGFRHVAYDDLEALEIRLHDSDVAAVLVEAVQGEAGVIQPSAGYLRGVRKLCDEHGVLLIVDEIQTGLGRTGSWFAFQHEGIVPDIVTVAKALGNGVPIGACWAKPEVAAAFQPGYHGSTFGGQPLAAAAALATLKVMRDEVVTERAVRRGEQLKRQLKDIPGVKDVRGKGLLLAAVLEEGISSTTVADAALKEGLVINAVASEAIRLAPPLLVSEDEVDQACRILTKVLSSISSSDGSVAEELDSGSEQRLSWSERGPGQLPLESGTAGREEIISEETSD